MYMRDITGQHPITLNLKVLFRFIADNFVIAFFLCPVRPVHNTNGFRAISFEKIGVLD